MPLEVPGPEATVSDWLAYCELTARTVPDGTRRVELDDVPAWWLATAAHKARLLDSASPGWADADELVPDGHLGTFGPFQIWRFLGNGRRERVDAVR